MLFICLNYILIDLTWTIMHGFSTFFDSIIINYTCLIMYAFSSVFNFLIDTRLTHVWFYMLLTVLALSPLLLF